MHTLRSLEQDLERMGLRPADTVLVHSSMKKIGQVEGGADTVIDAFMDYFKDGGLVVFPTLTYTLAHRFAPESERCRKCLEVNKPDYCQAREWLGRKPEFHVNITPACIGLLPNIFRKRPNVHRSLAPTHSVAAAGKNARDFTAGHERSETPCGKSTPWWKLYERGAKILHLGSLVSNTTFMHGVDEWRRAPDDPQGWLEVQVDVYDEHEHLVDIPRQRNVSGSSRLFPLLESQFETIGALTRHTFGDASAILMDCRKVADSALAALKENPRLFS